MYIMNGTTLFYILCGFWRREGKKTGGAGEKILGARTRTNIKLNLHVKPRPGIEPRPQRREASALTTVPFPLPAGAFSVG